MRNFKLFILIAIFLISFFINVINVSAIEATPSGDIKTKLKALQDEIASKAAKLKTEISSKLQNKSYWGIVKSKTDNTITLATRDGSKIISVNQDTLYSYSKGKLSLKTINTDDFLVALGDIDDTGVLTAKKIIKTSAVEFPNLETNWGIVTNIGENQFTIQTKDGKNIVISIDKETNLKFGEAAADLSDIKLKKAVITVGESNKNGVKARFVYILPYTSLNLKTSLTPTSSPTASPSATPKATKNSPTPTPKK